MLNAREIFYYRFTFDQTRKYYRGLLCCPISMLPPRSVGNVAHRSQQYGAINPYNNFSRVSSRHNWNVRSIFIPWKSRFSPPLSLNITYIPHLTVSQSKSQTLPITFWAAKAALFLGLSLTDKLTHLFMKLGQTHPGKAGQTTF